MKYLISLVIFFALFSCTTLDTSRLNFIKPFEKNTDQFVSDFSTISIFGNGIKASFTLSSIDDSGIETWVGPNYERILTFHGLIIKTEGFSNDLRLNVYNINSFYEDNNLFGYLDLSNPELNSAKFSLALENNKPSKECFIKKDFIMTLQNLRIKNKITICYSENGRPIFTLQKADLRFKPIKIEYHYRY